VAIKEQISASLMREGGLNSLELKGDMNLTITDASRAKLKLSLAPSTTDFGAELQFKQHPNVAKFGEPGTDRAIVLKDATKSFPVNRPLEVLRWRYTGRDESLVPLSSEQSVLISQALSTEM
jgi:coatomer subunit delta